MGNAADRERLKRIAASLGKTLDPLPEEMTQENAATVAASTGRTIQTTGAAVMQLGEVAPLPPSESSPLAREIFAMVERARLASRDMNRALWAPLTFSGYKAALQNRSSIARALYQEKQTGRTSYIPEDSHELRRFVGKLYDPERHTPDFAGFVNYLGAVNESLGERVLDMLRTAPGVTFVESAMRMHALVVGGSGSGKSELMKLMVHHYVRHPELGAVLVIDPHRKMAREIARWQEFARDPERLVYLDASVEDVPDAPAPALNPLAVRWVENPAKAEEMKAQVARQLADAIGVLRESDAMTGNMVTVATYCLRALLEVPGATLIDLRTMLRADEKHPLVRAARGMADSFQREFFEKGGGFFDESFRSARQAVSKRLDDGLFAPLMRKVMTAPEPFDLEAAVQASKVICIDVGSVGSHASDMWGRLMMAQVVALGQRRMADRTVPQTPLHVFVDEATRLMSPSVFTVLKELRKVGVALTMSQQGLGDGVERSLVGDLRGNTHVKLFGRSANMGQMFKMMSWSGDVTPLRNGQFIAAWGDEQKTILDTSTASHLADDRNAMSEADWQEALARQFKSYYRAPVPQDSPALDPLDDFPA